MKTGLAVFPAVRPEKGRSPREMSSDTGIPDTKGSRQRISGGWDSRERLLDHRSRYFFRAHGPVDSRSLSGTASGDKKDRFQ